MARRRLCVRGNLENGGRRQAAFAQGGGGGCVIGRGGHERAQDRERFEAGDEQELGELIGDGRGLRGGSEHWRGLRK